MILSPPKKVILTPVIIRRIIKVQNGTRTKIKWYVDTAQRLTARKAQVVFVNIISCVYSSQKIKIKTTLNFHKNKNINKNKYCQEWPVI